MKQGLYKEYLNRQEDLALVRGKIDMPGSIRNQIAKKHLLTCDYDELSENNLLNQILKTTVMILLQHAKVDEQYKVELKKEMLFFSGVDIIEPSGIRWNAIKIYPVPSKRKKKMGLPIWKPLLTKSGKG